MKVPGQVEYYCIEDVRRMNGMLERLDHNIAISINYSGTW